MTILELKPRLAITYGFNRYHVAAALAKQAELQQPTPAIYARAGRLLARGKADGHIAPLSPRGHYYHFTESKTA